MSDLTWTQSLLLLCGIALVAFGLIAFIAGLWRDARKYRQIIAPPHPHTNRDCFRDMR